MSTWFIVLLLSIGAVALFVVGLSLTLIFKGHHIDSEIATNKNMQRLGIKCAVQETREADGRSVCSSDDPKNGVSAGCSGNCSACDIPHASGKSE